MRGQMTSPNAQNINYRKHQVIETSQSSSLKPQSKVQYSQMMQIKSAGGYSTKGSCEASLQQITPNYRSQHAGSQNCVRYGKQPLYSMIPEKINKNVEKKTNGKIAQAYKGTLFGNHKKQSIAYCEESELIHKNSQISLTPQKNQPTPMSPLMRPTISNSSKVITQNPKTQKQQCYILDSKVQQTSPSKNRESGQKQAVVYNEFKYYTSGAELRQQARNGGNISNSLVNRRSDISASNVQHNSNLLQFELSPTDHRIFDWSSPQQSMNSLAPNGILKRHNPQGLMQESGYKEFQLKLKQEPEDYTPEAEQRIKDLQSYIEQLERDLKESYDKNAEIKQKFKEKNHIQSFDKNKKHLSDTEDSLILSEKKGKKRFSGNKNSLIVNSSLVINQQASVNSNQQQSNSSIVDVKIRPIASMKGGRSSVSPQLRKRESSSSVTRSISEKLEYQVQDYSDIGSSHKAEAQQDQTQDSRSHNHQSEDDECEGCERLKSLVFQAKEAIDDLKLEIEEWRDICSEKERELRQLQHKIYNDIVGVDKKIEFNEEIFTKEFDTNRPVTEDTRKIRNFIKQNKKRIRSRSKNQKSAQDFNSNKSVNQQSKKKSALKNVQDIMNEDQHFYQAEDQCIQTSFTQDTQSTPAKQSVSKTLSTANTLSPKPLKENNDPQADTQILHLKEQNVYQENELQKLRQQLSQATKQCEQFASILMKAKKKNKKAIQLDMNELKANYHIVSEIESYSILEKIQEWKRDEGLGDVEEVMETQIPRPMKLIQDIDIQEIEKDLLKEAKPIKEGDKVQNELLAMIKQEQENLKRQQESKFSQLQKQQQDYLSLLKSSAI